MEFTNSLEISNTYNTLQHKPRSPNSTIHPKGQPNKKKKENNANNKIKQSYKSEKKLTQKHHIVIFHSLRQNNKHLNCVTRGENQNFGNKEEGKIFWV
jgi:hypothetical protein